MDSFSLKLRRAPLSSPEVTIEEQGMALVLLLSPLSKAELLVRRLERFLGVIMRRLRPGEEIKNGDWD